MKILIVQRNIHLVFHSNQRKEIILLHVNLKKNEINGYSLLTYLLNLEKYWPNNHEVFFLNNRKLHLFKNSITIKFQKK